MIPAFRDRDDMDIAGARKKRQRGAKRVASFKTAIPGNDGCASCIESLGRIRNKQDGRRSPHDNVTNEGVGDPLRLVTHWMTHDDKIAQR